MQRFKLSYLVLIFTVFLSTVVFSQNNKAIDSIVLLRNLSQDDKIEEDIRVKYALEALRLSKQLKVDSTIILTNRKLSFLYLNIDRYEEYREVNLENKKIALKAKDSISHSVALENLGYYHYYNENIDSAFYYYYSSAKLFEILNEEKRLAGVLSNLVGIQLREKDFVGAESTAIKALEIYIKLPENEDNLDDQWILLNQLGVLAGELKHYDKALEHHDKAISISEKMNDGVYNKLYSLNNKALIFRELKDYDVSLKLYKDLIKTKGLFQYDPSFYALVNNNIAYTKFLRGDNNIDQIKEDLFLSKRICDSIVDDIGTLDVSYKLADLFLSQNKKDSAEIYAKRALNLSKKSNSNKTALMSLILLSKIASDSISKDYLYEHIRLNDSLLINERAARDKFASVRFETDQIKAENKQISKERLMFLVSSVGLLITLVLLYVIISQRAKNKELKFSKAQQEANEEIYNLMLAQQDKVDEGRTQEKKRISEELHDGILGRLFGTRLSLDSLNFVNTDDAIKTRGQYIDELKSIEQEIRKISHDLNTDFVSGSSFSDIIQALIETQTQAYELMYDYDEDDDIDWDELSNKTKIHVYRMLQETMQNIYKHANANHIKISFRLKNSVILLAVEDDGSGFNTNKARKGIGLKNFDSRASDIGGKVEIFSNPGEGTKVVIHVPTE